MHIKYRIYIYINMATIGTEYANSYQNWLIRTVISVANVISDQNTNNNIRSLRLENMRWYVYMYRYTIAMIITVGE